MRQKQDLYDPSNNWQVNKKRTYSFQKNPPKQSRRKKRKSANMDDLMSHKEQHDITYCLKIQKSRENAVNPMNTRLMTNLKYALKNHAKKFRVSDRVKVQNISTGEQFLAKTGTLPIVHISYQVQ